MRNENHHILNPENGELNNPNMRPDNCECDNTHEQNGTCCMPCWNAGFRVVAPSEATSGDLCADQCYAEDLATALERLLSQVSLLPGTGGAYVRDAYIQANNVLDEYQQAKDREDEILKREHE